MKGYIFINQKGLFLVMNQTSSHGMGKVHTCYYTSILNEATLFANSEWKQILKTHPLKDSAHSNMIHSLLVPIRAESTRTITLFPEDS